nr:cytochrome c biogenesis FN, mitochondrial [Tanacetum cinerariifolium]
MDLARASLTLLTSPGESNPIPQDPISAIHPPCIYVGSIASAKGFGLCRSKMMNGIVALHSPPMRKDDTEKNGMLFRFAGCVGSRRTSKLFTLKFKHVGVKGYPALLLCRNRSLLMLLQRRFAFSSLWTGALVDTGREQAKHNATKEDDTKCEPIYYCTTRWRNGWTRNDRGVEENRDVDGVPDFSTIIAQQLQNLLPTLLAQVGNQGKGGAIVYTCWIKKMEPVQDMSGYEDNQKVKYTARSFVGKALMLVPHLVTSENKRIERYIFGLALQIRRMVAAIEQTTIRKAVQKAGTLTDEAIRNGSLKKNIEKRGNSGEPSRDRNVKNDNKMTRTGNAFATNVNPVRREYTGTAPKCTNCNLHHSPESPCRACFSSNRLGYFVKDCRVVPRMVNPMNARNPNATRGSCSKCGGTDHFKAACPRLNQAQRPGGHSNQVVATDGGQGHGNNGNWARGGAFMLGERRLAKTRTS